MKPVCREGASNTSNCALLNTFICLVTESAETEDIVGLTGSGLHYGAAHTTDLPCPDLCGAVECKCNAMLFDLVVAGFLSSQFTDPLGFLPVWINPWLGPPAAAAEGGGSGASGGASTPCEVWLLLVTAAIALVLGLLVGSGAAAWFYRRPLLQSCGQMHVDACAS